MEQLIWSTWQVFCQLSGKEIQILQLMLMLMESLMRFVLQKNKMPKYLFLLQLLSLVALISRKIKLQLTQYFSRLLYMVFLKFLVNRWENISAKSSIWTTGLFATQELFQAKNLHLMEPLIIQLRYFSMLLKIDITNAGLRKIRLCQCFTLMIASKQQLSF